MTETAESPSSPEATRRPGPLARAVERVEPVWVARLGALGILLFGVLGTLHATGVIDARVLDLDRERTVPAAFSALLLLSAAAAGAVASNRGSGRRRSLAPLTLAVLFAWMALDEVFRLHERLDEQVDWVFLYAPLVVLSALAWVALLLRLDSGRLRFAWLAAAASWAISQVIEAVVWGGQSRRGLLGPEITAERALEKDWYIASMVTEEVLEMTGSLLFLLVLAALIPRPASHRSDRPAASIPPPHGNAHPDTDDEPGRP